MKNKNILKKLASIANKLDELGEVEDANIIDKFMVHLAKKDEETDVYDSEAHHKLQVSEPKRKQERVDREGYALDDEEPTRSLSTGYCPEHPGVRLGREADGLWRCPLDGKTYSFEEGWVDADGNRHSGGSVALQTPEVSGYFGTPHRIFDSRESSLNKVN